MTGNDIVKVVDEWIDDYRDDWNRSGQSQYCTNGTLELLTDLQRRLHKALDREIH